MPNHVEHRLEFYGDKAELDELFELIAGKDTAFDFEKLIPKPDCLRDTESGTNADLGEIMLSGGAVPYQMDDERRAECVRLAELSRAAKAETGYANWYDWSVACWGTKWNAYEVTLLRLGLAWPTLGSTAEKATLAFETAWTVPEPVLAQLAKRFPAVEFHGYAIDEGGCYTCGIDAEEGEVAFQYFEPTDRTVWNNGALVKHEAEATPTPGV